MASVRDVTSESDYKALISSLQPGALVSIFFHTPWAEPCKQMRTFFDALASQYPTSDRLAFLAVDAETLYDISEAFDVTAVPFFVLVRDGVTLQSISGSNSGQVRDAVEKEAGAKTTATAASLPERLSVTKPASNGMTESSQSTGSTGGGSGGAGSVTKDLSGYAPAADDPKTGPQYSSGVTDAEAAASSQEDLDTRLAGLVKAAPVMLFMKGTPSSPQCGFSRQLVAILREHGVRYGFFNILADEEVRQGLKVFADWPTFPQLWVGGELVGGLDIVKEEVETDPEFFAQYSVGRNNGGMAAPEAQTAPQVTA